MLNFLKAKSLTLIAVAFGIFFAGCSSPDPKNPVSGRHKTAIFHLASDPAGMNPYVAVGAKEAFLHSLLFDHLIELDFQTLRLIPQVATELPTVSPDKSSMTFHLRPDVKFSDGIPLTASDVEFSFKALMNPFVEASPKRIELQHFQDCVALDSTTIIFDLKDAGPFDLNRLAINFFILPKHIYDPDNLTDHFSGKEAKLAAEELETCDPQLKAKLKAAARLFNASRYQREKGYVIGSGKFAFDHWTFGQSIRMIKNPNYWNQDIQIGMDTIIFKTIPDLQTSYQALKSGEIDFGSAFTPDQYYNEMEGEQFDRFFNKESISYPFYEYVGWNMTTHQDPQRNLFQDKKVRRAMSHLINVQEIIDNIMMGTATPIVSMVYHQREEYNRDLAPFPYNPELATTLLEEAGWKDTDGDGILDKQMEGKQIDFRFSLYYPNTNETRGRIARHIQQTMSKVGIKVHVKSMSWKAMYPRLKQHALDAWIGGWAFDSDEQDCYSIFHSSQILNSGYNWMSYSSLQADSVMEAIVSEWNPEKRLTLHRNIQEILYEDQPYTLLFSNSARIAYNNRMTNNKWYGQRPCYRVWEICTTKSPQ